MNRMKIAVLATAVLLAGPGLDGFEPSTANAKPKKNAKPDAKGKAKANGAKHGKKKGEGKSLDALFQKLDANGDGQIDRAEFKAGKALLMKKKGEPAKGKKAGGKKGQGKKKGKA